MILQCNVECVMVMMMTITQHQWLWFIGFPIVVFRRAGIFFKKRCRGAWACVHAFGIIVFITKEPIYTGGSILSDLPIYMLYIRCQSGKRLKRWWWRRKKEKKTKAVWLLFEKHTCFADTGGIQASNTRINEQAKKMICV